MSELIIDQDNFGQHFFDARRHKPEKGQVMAKYTAIAEFVDGMMKKNIIDLLHKDKAEAAVQVLHRLGCAAEEDAVRVCKEICQDLIEGMTDEQVEQKVYRYRLESFYYTDRGNVPIGDPHWTLIGITNLDEFVDSNNNRCKIKTRIVDNIDEKEKIE